ncbi:MAG: LPS assembly lipoprotein LptE [Candidatus Kapaibacteriota bacterium]|jgi:hypothetical protein
MTVGARIGAVLMIGLLTGCYSFRGGSVPDHLKTISIATIVDNSGFGDASLREYATETLLQRFRSDNSLQLVDNDGDARLTPVLVKIQDQMINVQQSDLENQRRIVVAFQVEYVDAVKSRQVWKRTFENFDVYDVANATEDRQRAARAAIDRVVDDILLAVVSDW